MIITLLLFRVWTFVVMPWRLRRRTSPEDEHAHLHKQEPNKPPNLGSAERGDKAALRPRPTQLQLHQRRAWGEVQISLKQINPKEPRKKNENDLWRLFHREGSGRSGGLRELHGLQRQVKAVSTWSVPYRGVKLEQGEQQWHATCSVGGVQRHLRLKPKDHSEEELERSFQVAVDWKKGQEKDRERRWLSPKPSQTLTTSSAGLELQISKAVKNPAFSNFSLLEFHLFKKVNFSNPGMQRMDFVHSHPVQTQQHQKLQTQVTQAFFPTEVAFERSLPFQTFFVFQQFHQEAIPWQTRDFWKGHILGGSSNQVSIDDKLLVLLNK